MKLFFMIAMTLLMHESIAQKSTDSLQNLSDRNLGMYYLKQNRQQKTVGWILLVGGIAMAVGGIHQMTNNLFNESHGGEVLWLLGDVAVIVSIPLFISAAKNKGKAEILLRNQTVPLPFSNGIKQSSVGLRISLAKK